MTLTEQLLAEFRETNESMLWVFPEEVGSIEEWITSALRRMAEEVAERMVVDEGEPISSRDYIEAVQKCNGKAPFDAGFDFGRKTSRTAQLAIKDAISKEME